MMLSNDVNFEDLFALTIIEQHEPQLYKWIKQHKEMLTGQITYDQIYDHGFAEQNSQVKKKQYKEEIETLLCHKDSFSTNMALETLCILFPSFSLSIDGYEPQYEQDELRRKNSIGHPLKVDRYFTFSVDESQIIQSEIAYILDNITEQEIKDFIIKKDKTGASIELFREIQAHINEDNKDKIPVLIKCIIRVSEKLLSTSTDGMFPRHASIEAVRLVCNLFLRLNYQKRYTVLEDLIKSMDGTDLDSVSWIIMCFEEGQKMKKQGQISREKYPSLESEVQLNKVIEGYLEKVRVIRDQIDVNDLIEKGYFLGQYVQYPEGLEYLHQSISTSSQTIIHYLASTMGNLEQERLIEIDLNDRYKVLVEDEQVLNAIHDVIETGEFNKLGKGLKRAVAAFLMKQENPTDYSKTIQIKDIDKKIEEIEAKTN